VSIVNRQRRRSMQTKVLAQVHPRAWTREARSLYNVQQRHDCRILAYQFTETTAISSERSGTANLQCHTIVNNALCPWVLGRIQCCMACMYKSAGNTLCSYMLNY